MRGVLFHLFRASFSAFSAFSFTCPTLDYSLTRSGSSKRLKKSHELYKLSSDARTKALNCEHRWLLYIHERCTAAITTATFQCSSQQLLVAVSASDLDTLNTHTQMRDRQSYFNIFPFRFVSARRFASTL